MGHIGCLKLQVSFHKRATNHRALLQKTTILIRQPMGLGNLVDVVYWVATISRLL